MKKLFIWVLVLTVIYFGASYFISRTFPKSYEAEVINAAEEFSVDINLVYSVIKAESSFAQKAVSPKGAKGLMQLTDDTAAWCAGKLGITSYDVFSAGDNIRMGTYYLSYLLGRYHDKNLALAAYNAGHGNVDKWLKNPEYSKDGNEIHKIPFPETERYLKRVLFYERVYRVII